MAFENLAVQRLILHEVFQRRDDGNAIAPRYGGQLVQLPANAMDVFKERIIEAMGSDSQSMEMEIAKSDAGSAVEISSSLLSKTDATYITHSQKFADKLTDVQVARNLPGGMLVVFSGTVGASARPFVAVIKAETQGGFRRQVSQGGGLGLQYLQDLFLTPAAKLYKIGMFVRDGAAGRALPTGWKAFVYDSHMTRSNRDGAAKYFFDSFLGCRVPENSAFLTKAFFDNTKDFIKSLDVPPEKRADLLTSLYTYLKVDQTPTIEVNGFSTSYIPTETRDSYRAFMRERKFPLTVVQKDISELQGVLKLRKVAFRSNIRLTAPPEAFRDLITIETIPQDGAKHGQPSEWTRITIRDEIRDQE
jgi:37-kD nucleoid-associated bacterial protein